MTQIETKMVPEQGVTLEDIWVPVRLLSELAEQGEWDSQMGSAFLINDRETGDVLVKMGLAVRETKGGYHKGPELEQFLNDLIPLPPVPAAGKEPMIEVTVSWAEARTRTAVIKLPADTDPRRITVEAERSAVDMAEPARVIQGTVSWETVVDGVTKFGGKLA